MKAEFTVLNSAYKYISDSEPLPETDSGVLGKLSVFKNEEFGIQLLIKADREFIASKGRHMDICWKGLIDKIRVEIEVVDTNYVKIPSGSQPPEKLFSMKLVDYVMDDEGNLVSDILIKSGTRHASTRDQIVYITGKIPKDFETSELGLTIRAFYSQGYEDEQLIFESTVDIEVMDYVLEDIKDSKFYMDLWQDPCNWARAYDVDYYSEEHMQIIDNYMHEMSLIGQRVCDFIISDYPWAGKRCSKAEENEENLFELNIISLTKNLEGELECDFTAMDNYLELAKKHGMAEEINLFGILGNKDGGDFKSPLSELKDPVRVSYFDKKSRTFKYINNKNELKIYFKQVFAHINALGLWDKTLIVSDEQDDADILNESIELFKEVSGGLEIKIKSAVNMNIYGFLGWAYGLWSGAVINNGCCKNIKYSADDMHFLYPGRDGKPLESLRLKNIVYGIQDWIVLSAAEENMDREDLEEAVRKLMDIKKDVPVSEYGTHKYTVDYRSYMEFRKTLFKNM